jgi:hypothetical protein
MLQTMQAGSSTIDGEMGKPFVDVRRPGAAGAAIA